MMRLGFVGVGKHAQKMAAAFRECGAEIVAYSRKEDYPVDGAAVVPFCEAVRYRDWRAMLSPAIDALIICAPPEITMEVALACAKAGKRCVATKPLMWGQYPDTDSTRSEVGERPAIESDLYVDLWRLYSPAWQALKDELRGKTIQSVHVDFYGNGPVRNFSGLLDYGPHALAFVADLLGGCGEFGHGSNGPGLWELYRRPEANRPCITICTGNGARDPRARVSIVAGDAEYRWEELGESQNFMRNNVTMLYSLKSMALASFCRAFLAGEPSNTLALSCQAVKVLMPMVA